MLELGRKWVEGGRLRDVGDIFMLDLAEVERAAKESELDLGPLVRAGRQNLSQSAMRKNVFPVMDSRGRFYVPQTQESLEGHVTGYAVSPGLARGRIKVLACPSEKELLLGEILVARATDPSWTPLFVNAAAIILEVGGVLQHGALVAREYGKPCVSGIQNATGLFHDGEEVEVDGNLGLVRQLVHKE
jgi:pyruvate,water dikinase